MTTTERGDLGTEKAKSAIPPGDDVSVGTGQPWPGPCARPHVLGTRRCLDSSCRHAKCGTDQALYDMLRKQQSTQKRIYLPTTDKEP